MLSPKLMETPSDNLMAALDAFAKGYVPVAMLPGSKIPAEPWNRWGTEVMSVESIHMRWESTRNGIALLCRDLLVIDIDDQTKLDVVIEKSKLKNAPICRTPGGGFHVHARPSAPDAVSRKIRANGEGIDVLAKNSLSIIPHSHNADGVPYVWLGDGLPPRDELPVACLDWIIQPEPTLPPARIILSGESKAHIIRRARAYVRRIPGAISGQRGHDRTIYVAGILVQQFCLSIEQALPLILEWNQTCEPPWSMKELLHKLQDAYRLRHRYERRIS